MKIDSFYSNNIKNALRNDPPGEWMPTIPENCIKLSSGFLAPDLVPSKEIKESVAQLLDEEQDLPLHYVGTPKIDQLKQQIQTRLIERGMDVEEDELLVTAGACQAIDLIARILIDEQTVVAVEAPTYMEALEIFRNYTNQFISIPMDEYGMQTEVLEHRLVERKEQGLPLPKLIYTIPTFHNPTGTTLSMERRKHLLELASTFDFLVLEDDAYGELYFDKSLATLNAMDQENRVLYVGSLSKVVAPGLRIGWVKATNEIISTLYWFKKDLDHPFAQAIMATYLENHPFGSRLDIIRASYKKRANTILSALETYLSSSVSWYIPDGGYFVWVKIDGVDTGELLQQALKEGVSFLPGKYFFLQEEDGKEWLRLSFSYHNLDELKQGVKKLAQVLEKF
ncbi:PLP-dependent aminotransferase family protein [Gracilibacillus sp. S3-1-1]|uniref:PLP-dependent aminotransferase family protein n=1 Tax=Gracilibacillus pellucidus TaxID=3095368 RepID=A0ACC6M2T0_9BACI|nr:PLP-dependent aminotransferase family protein [Gracilibacillus sp. S3-1-1]MDX8045264.1 PLP-dependent aminotransferase family protein [Gracilibacillus sp. S3-1-1]